MIQPADGWAWACDLTRIGPVSWSQVHEVLAAWATYRQQLRDFPATWTPAETVDFPDAPA